MIPLSYVRTPVELQSNNEARAEQEPGGLLALALLALVAGGAAGPICAGFRLALKEADRLRDWAIADAHNLGFAGFLPRCRSPRSRLIIGGESVMSAPVRQHGLAGRLAYRTVPTSPSPRFVPRRRSPRREYPVPQDNAASKLSE